MASDDLDLGAVLASRICHDLVGPVGAISNGLELLAEEDDAEMRRQALDLVAHSAEQAARRLTFYRLAFGASGGADVAVPLSDARGTAELWLQGSRVALSWPDSETTVELDKPRLRLLLNLLVVGVEALPRGGTVAVRVAEEGRRLAVTAAGTGATVEAPIASALAARVEPSTLTPKQLPAHLAARLAGELGGALKHGADAEGLRFEAVLGAA